MNTQHKTKKASVGQNDVTGPICPNCGQWQHPDKAKGYHDCLNDCAEKGFAPKVDRSYKAQGKPQHSPWNVSRIDELLRKCDDMQAHAEALAEALRDIRNALDAPHRYNLGDALLNSREKLAQWEGVR